MNQAEKSPKWKSSWYPMGQAAILAVVWAHFLLQDPWSTWQKRRLHCPTEKQAGAGDLISSLTREEQVPFMGPVLIRAGSGTTSLTTCGLTTGESQRH